MAFVDNARHGGGRVLIHCASGVNRSAALCVAYLMMSKLPSCDLRPLDALQRVCNARCPVLWHPEVGCANPAFLMQLAALSESAYTFIYKDVAYLSNRDSLSSSIPIQAVSNMSGDEGLTYM